MDPAENILVDQDSLRIGRKRAACGSSDPMTREKAPCVQATLFAHCRADGGHYFKLSSRLSNYAEAGKPDETAKLNAGTYERLLRSIRFKKGRPPPPWPPP